MLICPHCRSPLQAGGQSCERCGCQLSRLTQLLGSQQVRVERLIDHARCLPLKDAQRLEHCLDAFERRFPQLHVVVFLGGLLPDVTAAEAGFWLLNQGVCERPTGVRSTRWGVAVIVDPVERRAGLALGYSLEACLPPGYATELLHRAHVHLAHDEYVRAVDAVLSALDRKLRSFGRAQRRPSPSSQSSSHQHLGLEVVPTAKPPSPAPSSRT